MDHTKLSSMASVLYSNIRCQVCTVPFNTAIAIVVVKHSD